ncbi:MAG: hypothetical protein AB1696_22655 [Planctomycetota bacterium]
MKKLIIALALLCIAADKPAEIEWAHNKIQGKVGPDWFSGSGSLTTAQVYGDYEIQFRLSWPKKSPQASFGIVFSIGESNTHPYYQLILNEKNGIPIVFILWNESSQVYKNMGEQRLQFSLNSLKNTPIVIRKVGTAVEFFVNRKRLLAATLDQSIPGRVRFVALDGDFSCRSIRCIDAP